MYKKMIAVLPVLVVLLAISGFHACSCVRAPVRDVPSEEEFAPYWEEAARMPIMSDKGPMRRLEPHSQGRSILSPG